MLNISYEYCYEWGLKYNVKNLLLWLLEKVTSIIDCHDVWLWYMELGQED